MKIYIKTFAVFIFILVIVFIFVFNLVLFPLKHKSLIIKYANEYGVKPEIVASIINTESSFNKNSISNKGAVGLMQIMPQTAQMVCELQRNEYSYYKLFLPENNIKIGVYYINYLIKKFTTVDTAIVAYNAGEGAVRTWLNSKDYSDDGINLKHIPYNESNKYLARVKQGQRVYRWKINY